MDRKSPLKKILGGVSRGFRRQMGFSMIELLVAVALLGLSGLAISRSVIQGFRILKFSEVNFIANSLAMAKMEEFAAKDTIEITAALNAVEPAVTYPDLGLTFTRTSTIVENLDETRTVTVNVRTNQPPVTSVEFTSTFVLWE